MTNGYDKYLEYQYRQTGDFYTLLFRAIMQADTKNSARLAKGFPEEVEAYRAWSRVGVKEFIKHGLAKSQTTPKIQRGICPWRR